MRKVWKRLAAACLAVGVLLGATPCTAMSAEPAVEGTFTAVAMNVDGLPQKIIGISINADGPGSDGTKAISQKMAEYGWDMIAVSEDFNYHNELMSALSSTYSCGTHRGGVSWLTNDTDGLNLLWKNSLQVTGEKWVAWEENYSSGIAGTGNGADTMINKGFRYYQATLADGVSVDVYTLHMDADSDAEDIAARESQLRQLVSAIKASDNKNPIIIMGDTNSRYTREQLQTLLIDGINADSRFTIQDAWVEKAWNGVYPAYGSEALVAKDKGGTYDYPQAEIVDKVFYINNTDSDVTLTCNSYTVETSFVSESGTPLADHWPVVVEFGYTKNSGAEHSHVWDEGVVQKPATCTEEGSILYTCTCSETRLETIPALGHTEVADEAVAPTCTETGLTEGVHCSACGVIIKEQQVVPAAGHHYVDGVCTVCGEKDPDAPVEPTDPEGSLGNMVTEITSGNRYAIVFQSTIGNYSLRRSGLSVEPEKLTASAGDTLDAELIWTITQTEGGYYITTQIDGETYYLYRTKTFTGSGYRVALQKEAFVWRMSFNSTMQSFRFYDKTSYGSSYYLRFYNTRVGWQATTVAAGVKLYEVQ